jgi:cytochrome c553
LDWRVRWSDPLYDEKEQGMFSKKLLGVVLITLLMAAGAAQAGGDPAKGKELSVDCTDCHGENGLGDAETPAIAGLDEAFLIEQMQAFKSGARPDKDDSMLMYVEDLSDQDMADLAAYYAALPGKK